MRRPAVFVAHGAPTIAIEHDEYTARLRTFGESLRGARAMVIASAHWQTRGSTRVNAVAQPETIYDFGGFADELFAIRYTAPGDPDLAHDVASLLDAPLELQRGWDHGVWTPLVHVCPDMTMPIVEISLPIGASPRELLDVGRALAPLRDDNVVIAGSGGIVHNLALIDLRDKNARAASWAEEFDGWIAERIASRDFDELARYQEIAPHASRAVPTPEHLDPLFITCGASRDDDPIETIYAGFQYGSLSLRSVAFGNI